MKKTLIPTILLLISTIFFFGCKHEVENPNPQFVFSTDPIFPKTDCEILVDEEVNLSTGNWQIQEIYTINVWNAGLTSEKKDKLFNSLEESEIIELKKLETYDKASNTYTYRLSLSSGIVSDIYKFSYNNSVSNPVLGRYGELYPANSLVKKVFENIPQDVYSVKDDKIIFSYFTDMKTISNTINGILTKTKKISIKDPPYNDIDIYTNSENTKYYYHQPRGHFYSDLYFLKD